MVSEIAEAVGEIFSFLKIFTLRRRRAQDQIKKVVEIYDIMNGIIHDTDVERILVFKGHNGGGLIKPGSELYSSCIYEEFVQPFKSVKTIYQNLPLDKEYVKILLDICSNKEVKIRTENLPDCFLKNIYLSENVKESHLYYLYQDKKSVYYCSLATSKDVNNLNTPAQVVAKTIGIKRIREIMKP